MSDKDDVPYERNVLCIQDGHVTVTTPNVKFCKACGEWLHTTLTPMLEEGK